MNCHPLAAAVDLLRSTEMRMRAVDSSNNMMPEKLTWNLMGARTFDRQPCAHPHNHRDRTLNPSVICGKA